MEKKKLALIHILKKELGLSDQKYRRILKAAAGVETAKDLDEDKFRKLMNYFVRSPYYRQSRNGLTLRQKMFIRSLAKQLGWDQDHLNNFLSKYYNRRDINRLSKKEASKAIESLKATLEHSS